MIRGQVILWQERYKKIRESLVNNITFYESKNYKENQV